jgi:hypothetical protein
MFLESVCDLSGTDGSGKVQIGLNLYPESAIAYVTGVLPSEMFVVEVYRVLIVGMENLEHEAEHNNCRMRALESDLEPCTPTQGLVK